MEASPPSPAPDEDRCIHDHPSSLHLSTNSGRCVCIMCFVKLLSHPSSFLTHKLYVVSELRESLRDPVFCTDFLHRHRHFVVAPICEALLSSSSSSSSSSSFQGDNSTAPLAEVLMDLILDLCGINHVICMSIDPLPLVEDFVHHIVLHLGSSSGLSCSLGQSYTLHVLGLLLDNYCKINNVLPDAVRSHRGLLPNLVTGLKLPGDQLRGEILFLLYKLCYFEDGIMEILPFISDLIESTVMVLTKSENNGLRTNCIALLTTLAQRSVINISFQQCSLDSEAFPLPESDFPRNFVEAIKGSLISSDVQVQEAALQLICYMCPPEPTIHCHLGVLINNGIMDYVYEVLRICENIENIVIWSVRVLRILSAAREAFVRRFAIGIETVNRVLDLSLQTSLCSVQPDTLQVIVVGLTGCPGSISSIQAERLFQTLISLLKKYAGDSYGLQHDVFNMTCSAVGTLLKLPCILGIQNLNHFIETTVSNTFLIIAAAGPLSLEHQSLKHAIILLRESFSFSLKGHSLADSSLPSVLFKICEMSLLPITLKYIQLLEDEDTVLEAISTFHLMIETPDLLGVSRLAESLARASWFNLSFELMARFPTLNMRSISMNLFGSIIKRLDSDALDKDVKAQFSQLPSDPQDLLVLLTLKSANDPHLKLTQIAIISILYVNQIYGKRFTEEAQILACLEHYLLINSSTLLHDSLSPCIVRQLLSVYVLTLDSCSIQYSLEAENSLIELIQRCQSGILTSTTHQNVFQWLLQKKSLEKYMVCGILTWFKSSVRECSTDHIENKVSSVYEDLSLLLMLLEEDDLCALLFNRVLDEVLASQDEGDIRIVAECYIRFVKESALAANKLCLGGIMSNIRNWLAIYCSNLPGVLIYLVELLYQLLCAVSCDEALDEECWYLLANQFAYVLVEKLNHNNSGTSDSEVIVLLSLLTMILHKSVENVGFLTQATEAILSNEQLQNAVTSLLEKAKDESSFISKLELETRDGWMWGCMLTFHLLCLRCAVVMHTPNLEEWSSTHTNLQIRSSMLPRNYKDIEYLCQLLYFGSPFLKVLSSSCLAEACYWLSNMPTNNESNESNAEQSTLESLKSIIMVLQGAIFDTNTIVQKNCSFSLYLLITNTNFNAQEKAEVQGSMWLRFLIEEFVTALSTPGESVPCTTYVVTGLLTAHTNPTWIFSILSPICISAIISCLTPRRITPAIMAFFKVLHDKGCIEEKVYIEKLHVHLKVTQKIVYEESHKLEEYGLQVDQRHRTCSLGCRRDSDSECLQSFTHILNLSTSYLLDPLTGTRHSLADDHSSTRLLMLIDEFLQETL